MVKFLNLAQRNTTNNIETCGILCGKLVRFKLNFAETILLAKKLGVTPILQFVSFVGTVRFTPSCILPAYWE